MNRYLFLLRHAEAERGAPDISRPLSTRGTESIGFVGNMLRARAEQVQYIYSSTAIRAAQTANGICTYLDYVKQDILQEPSLYLAGLHDLLEFIAACPPQCNRLMLVGHNPGLEQLLAYLASAKSPAIGRALTTMALAKLEITGDWLSLTQGCGKLLYLLEPGNA